MPRLIIIKGADLGKTLKVERGATIQIGRRSDNDLPVNDSALSRYHCEVVYDGKEVVLKDKGSRHGTYVNNNTVQKSVPLSDGDEIRLGKCVIRFEWTADRKKSQKKGSQLELEEEEEFDTRDMEFGPTMDASAPSPDIFAPPDDDDDSSGPGVAMVKASDSPAPATFSPTVASSDTKGRQTIITLIAVAAIAVLVGAAAFLLMEYYGEPEQTGPVPMNQLTDIDVKVPNIRVLLQSPPTYVIEIEVTNKSDEQISVKVRDFLAVDKLGFAYRPLKPTSENDFRTVKIDPGATAKGSLNFEIQMGTEIGRLIFQSRGFLYLESD